jgi:hypothetical protein
MSRLTPLLGFSTSTDVRSPRERKPRICGVLSDSRGGALVVLEIIHIVIMLAMLACGLVIAWYAQKIHTACARGLALLDARDIDQRRYRAETGKAQDAWRKEMSNSLRDTRAILGKLYSIAAESSPHERDTHHMLPPDMRYESGSSALKAGADGVETERASDGDGDSEAETRCMDRSLAMAALASARAAPSSH